MSSTIKTIETALAQLKPGDTRARARLLNRLGRELLPADCQRALETSLECQQLCQGGELERELGEALDIEARTCCARSDFARARARCQDALRLFEKQKDDGGKADALITMGNILATQGDYAKALVNHLSAFKLKQDAGDDAGAAAAAAAISADYELMADYNSALEHALKSLSIQRALNDRPGQAASLMGAGRVYDALGDQQQALQCISESIELFRGSDDGRRGHAYNAMGEIYRKQGEYQNALNHYQKGLKIAEQAHDRQAALAIMINIGQVCISLKQPARAERLFTKSLQDATVLGDRQRQAECLLALGDLLLAQQQEGLGFSYLTQAQALADELGARAVAHRAHRSLAAACKRSGELRSALEHFERYHQLDKEIFNEAAERRRQGLSAQLETQQAERKAEIFRLKNVELVKAFQQLQQLHRSLQEADRQKSKLLEQLSQQAKQLEAMAREDPLTGLLNRRSLALEMAKEFATAWRFKKSLTVAIADIDNFKRINEQFGEDRGDMVLRAVGNMLCKGLRSIDTVGRQGGGQFAMVLAGSNVKNAWRVCDRIRAEIEGYRWAKLAPDLAVTISIGMTDDLTLGDHERMVAQAEAQLAKAKRQGKNQVCWQ